MNFFSLSLALGLILSSWPQSSWAGLVAAGEIPSLQSSRAPVSAEQFQQIVSKQLSDFIVHEPKEGLAQLETISSLPASDIPQIAANRSAAKVLLELLAAPGALGPTGAAPSQARLIGSLGIHNMETIDAAARHLESMALLDSRLRERLARFKGSDLDAVASELTSFREDSLNAGKPPATVIAGLVSETPRSTSYAPNGLGPALSQGALAALRAAEQGDYNISVLRGRVGDQDRTLVLLGEIHAKNREASEQGRAVLREFQYIGIEGVESKFWHQRLFFKTVMPLAYIAAFLTSRGARNRPTTIRDAEVIANFEAVVEHFESMDRKRLQSIEKKILKKFAKGPDSIVLFKHNKERLVSSAQIALSILEDLRAGKKPGLVETHLVFSLEKDHRLDIFERSWYLVASVIAGPLLWLCLLMPLALPIFILNPAIISFQISDIGSTAILSFLASMMVFFATGMVRMVQRRNTTMAENITSLFERRPEMREMLTVMGKDHIPDIRDLMTREYGFKEIPFH